MIRRSALVSALLLASPALAQDASPAPDQAPQSQPQQSSALESRAPDFDLAREKVVDCEGHKFVFAWGAGANPTRVTLCSKKGATNEELIRMIDDAASKIEGSNLPEDRRNAIVEQMNGKIRELEGKAAPAPATGVVTAEAPPLSLPPARDLSQQLLGEPGTAMPPPEATVPSLAAIQRGAPPPPPVVLPRPASAPLPKPSLTFQCISPEYAAGGPCITLGRDTILVVKSGSALAAGISLQFARNGDVRFEKPLGALRKGDTIRFGLPRELCSGVSEGEAEIRVAGSGQVLDTEGPYLLRC